MKKKIVVTGGKGFIGFNLINKYLNDNYELISIDSEVSRTKNNFLKNVNIQSFKLDISNKNQLTKILEDCDIVIHLAAKGNVVESVESPIENFNSNVKATLDLLEIMKNSKKCKNIIFSSTGGALMGNTQPPVDENSTPKPISPYGASKLACEAYINAYSECYGIKSIIFRFGNVYGPFGSHKKGVINKFIRNSINKKRHLVHGSLESSRDYIHVFDICEAITLGIKYFDSKEFNNQIFHLANYEEITLLKLIQTIDNIANSKTPFDIYESRLGEVFKNFSSYKKAENYLGFRPKYSLDKGIKELYNWTINNEKNLI